MNCWESVWGIHYNVKLFIHYNTLCMFGKVGHYNSLTKVGPNGTSEYTSLQDSTCSSRDPFKWTTPFSLGRRQSRPCSLSNLRTVHLVLTQDSWESRISTAEELANWHLFSASRVITKRFRSNLKGNWKFD